MTQFCTYDEKGQILESHTIPDGMAVGLFTTAQRYIFGPYTSDTHYIENGEAVPFPPRPQHSEWDWANKQWVVIPEHAAVQAKMRRQQLLQASDWTDTLSAKGRLGDALYTAWQDYRQALRDVTIQPGFPFEITWPEPPTSWPQNSSPT